jgi:hypothetical protein
MIAKLNPSEARVLAAYATMDQARKQSTLEYMERTAGRFPHRQRPELRLVTSGAKSAPP